MEQQELKLGTRPLFTNPELQNILASLGKLNQSELELVQFILEGMLAKS